MAETYTITSHKHKQILVHENHSYHYHSKSKNHRKIYWRCTKREICNARCITNANLEEGVHVEKSGRHEHEGTRAEIEVRRTVASIKRRAEQHPNEPPTTIIREEVQNIHNEEVQVLLPERQTLLRMVNRNQNTNRPVIPRSLEECIILPPFDTTLQGEKFLQFDSGAGDPNRLLIFTTNAALLLLSTSEIFLADGTFKTVPTIFFQLYTIHGLINNNAFPLVYCVLVRKDEDTYRKMYEEIVNLCGAANIALNPRIIMTDFELAAMNAGRHYFPNAEIKGCLFHFCQSIWRNVVQLGLKAAYNDEADRTVRDEVRKLMAIPFVPLEHVQEVFDSIAENVTERVEELVLYIERTYVTGVPARGRRRAVQPRFPPQTWNAYNLVLNGVQRTTNSVEGWHSKFQKAIVTHHANIWKFIEHLKKDQHDNNLLINQILSGHVGVRHPIKRSYILNLRHIEQMVQNYNTYREGGDMDRYLRAIAYRLKLYPEEIPEENPAL